jgi:hypothetical protein
MYYLLLCQILVDSTYDFEVVNYFFQTASPHLVMHITTSADNLIGLIIPHT